MNKTWSLLLLVAACGPAATTGTTIPSNTTATPARPAATPCPTGDALTETARKAWGKGAGTVSTDCVALLRDGETVWLLDGYFEPEAGDMIGTWTAVVTPAGDVRWADGDDEMPYGAMMRSYSSQYTAADLDGDGNDEVLWVSGYDHGGYMNESLVAATLTDEGLVFEGEGIELSSDNSAAVESEAEIQTCSATWEVVPAGDRQQVAVTYDAGCGTAGRKLFAWNGKALAEVPQ